MLQIIQTIRAAFDETPIVAYRRNKIGANKIDLIGANKIPNNKKVIKNTTTKTQGSSKPSNTRRNNLCCQQVIKTETFSSYKTGETYRIFHQLNCKSFGLIYLLQCQICLLQYIGKSETPFNICFNNHEFQRHAKFTLIEKVMEKFASTAQMRLLLKKREISGF